MRRPGRYSDEAVAIADLFECDGLLLVVVGGVKGDGCELRFNRNVVDRRMFANALRVVADQMDRDDAEEKKTVGQA